MKVSFALLAAAAAAGTPGTIKAQVGVKYWTTALRDGCTANAEDDQIETLQFDKVQGDTFTATVSYKAAATGIWSSKNGVHVKCWHWAGEWDAVPVFSTKDTIGRGSATFTFKVQTNLQHEQHILRCGIIDLSSSYDQFDEDARCANDSAGRGTRDHHFDNADAPFTVVPGVADYTNKCTISGSKNGGEYLSTIVKTDISQAACLDLGESTFRANADGTVETDFQDTGSKASVLRAYGRKGVRCLFKPVKCAGAPSSFRAGQNLMANDRSMGWDALPLTASQCYAEASKMARACGSGAVIMARAEAGAMCSEHNHNQDWCQGDKPSPVPKQPFEPGYVAPSAGGDRNPGSKCFGTGCGSYANGEQVCKHFKCHYSKGKTTVFGFINSNEKYHCEKKGSGCVCTCHENDQDHKCTICHDTPDFSLDATTHHSRKARVCNEHCPDFKPTAPKNCKITFNKGCPNEFDHSRAVQDAFLREIGLKQFSDQFVDHEEHAADAASCHARATTLRRQCFYHPKDTTGFGSVTASFNGGAAVADKWSKVCAINFHADKNQVKQSCPAMFRKYGIKGLWQANDPKRFMYHNHVEENQAQTEEACLERATDLRKLCYTKIADGQGQVTAQWLATGAQRTDAWENVCGITVQSCPTLAAFGPVPESHRTGMTTDSVVIEVHPKHPELGTATRRAGLKVIDTRELLTDSTDNGKRHPDSSIEETKNFYSHGNLEVIEHVSDMTQAKCLAKARSIHEDCYTGAQAGSVKSLWMPSQTTEVVTSSKDKKVYFKKTAAEMNGQTGCKISMSDSSDPCPRATKQDKQTGWDQKPHYEWSHKNKDSCLARAQQIYDHCYFWPGSDDTLNNYINKNDEFVGRPDLFFPGSVTATWEGDRDEYGTFTSSPAEVTICTGANCAPGSIASDFSNTIAPHTSVKTDEIARAVYDKDANQNFQTAEADRTMGYTTPISRKVTYGNNDGTQWAN